MEDYLLEYKARKMKKSTISQYKNDLRIILIYILERCNNKIITQLSKKDFRNLSLWLSNDLKVSNARVNRLMSCCRSFMTYIEDDDDYEYNQNQAAKIHGLPKEAVRDIVFLEDDIILKLIDKLMNEKRYKEATLVALLYDTGARKNEIAQVEKYSFYDENKNVTNKLVAKRGKVYQAVYHSLTKKCVKPYLEERGQDNIPQLFITSYNLAATPEAIYDWVVNLRKDLYEITGKEYNINVHSFRHSYIQNLSDGTHIICRELNLGKLPIEKIQLLVGHSDANTTLGYKKDDSINEIENLFGIKFE